MRVRYIAGFLLNLCLLLWCAACTAEQGQLEPSVMPTVSSMATPTSTITPSPEPTATPTPSPSPSPTPMPTPEPTPVDINAIINGITRPVAPNAKAPLELKTYDGENQAMHPKVLYFGEGWNGYKWWMVYTPYPYCNDDYENPCLAVSQDGINWDTPPGAENPITGAPPTLRNGSHYSDGHLLMRGDTMELWFRYNESLNDGTNADLLPARILRMTSADGVNWTQIEEVINAHPKSSTYLSPAVLWEEDHYTLWYVDFDGILYQTQSYDAKTWSDPVATDLATPGYRLWHIDIIRTGLGYEIVASAKYPDGKNNLHGQSIFYALSADGTQFTPSVRIVDPNPAAGAWDKNLYRSSLVYYEAQYRLYYSAMSDHSLWKTYLSQGPTISDLTGYAED